MAQDALAVLAHIYLRYGQARRAVALFGALAEIGDTPAWARRAHCIALVQVGRHDEAVAAATDLLNETCAPTDRVPLLHALAQASFALGETDRARAAFSDACAAANLMLRRHPANRNP